MTISRHAQERYAERIMDRDSKTDIAVFIRDHSDKIQTDIERMIEYGNLLYEGKSFKDPKREVAVTINGMWVIIWDPNDLTVITLFRIDLGVGEDLNKEFVDSALKQIDKAKVELFETQKRTAGSIETYNRLIEDAEASMLQYRKLAKDLESYISGCRQMIQAVTTDNTIADNNLREKVEILIGKQKF